LPQSKSSDRAKVKESNPSIKHQYVSYPVKIRVVSVKGTCALGHKVGQEWISTYDTGKGPDTPNICAAALMPMLANLKALQWGAPIAAPTPDPDTIYCCCPDPLNPVVFETKRLKDKPIYLKFPFTPADRVHGYSRDFGVTVSFRNRDIGSKKR
jgi:uncharacterized repeat protein (TIGR04076 family)